MSKEDTINTLTNVCQLLDGWHCDTAWTEWDTNVRNKVSNLLKDLHNDTKEPAEERIKKAFPEMEPSAGHDYVDELIGLLRVARMHISDAENRCARYYAKLKQLRYEV
jgi:hypothetical protein